MTHSLRYATPLALVLLAASATIARSQCGDLPPPSPTSSLVEPVIVGGTTGQVIGDGYRVVVRDACSQPVINSTVSLTFGPAIHPYATQVAPVQVNCATRTIRYVTNVFGAVEFHPQLGGFDNAAHAEVRADGILLGLAKIRSTDYDGDGDTDVSDLNRFRLDFLSSPFAPESDFDESSSVGVGDLSIFRSEFVNSSAHAVCP